MNKIKAFFGVTLALALSTAILAGCGNGDPDGKKVCEHTNLQKVDGKDATCLDTGNYSYYKCECGELFSDKNGTKSTTLADVTIPTTRHDMHLYSEQVGVYEQYYFCDTCGRYYEDFDGKFQIPYEDFCDSSVTPVEIYSGWSDPAGANAENRDFTLRCFIGWNDSKGLGFTNFPADGTVWVNVNLNRKCTLQNTGWYNFGVAYNSADGLQYKNFEAGHLTKVAPEFTKLFIEQGGIWVRVVRDGTNCAFYFEDKYGIPILISSNPNFEEDEALYRFAFGTPDNGAVAGWSLAPEKAEICWGIANPRCVFSKK